VAITAILNTYLFLPVTEPTYSNNKMTSYEMKNRFTRICLFVTKKVFKKSAGLQVALSLSLSLSVSLFAKLGSFPCSNVSVYRNVTLSNTGTFYCNTSPQLPRVLSRRAPEKLDQFLPGYTASYPGRQCPS
jgi:hypothetical protein